LSENTERAESLFRELLAEQKRKRLPPVHLWNPDHEGEIDIRIARDGTWYYLGTPIPRKAMVRLFSTVLRREDDAYFLVTPVEKLRIRVDDAPFVAVLLEVEGEGEDQNLLVTTNTEDHVLIDDEHPLRVETIDGEPAPYVLVRDSMEALVSRNVFYQLVDLAKPRKRDGETELGVWSAGEFFSLGKL
jgi:hypothetical protein